MWCKAIITLLFYELNEWGTTCKKGFFIKCNSVVRMSVCRLKCNCYRLVVKWTNIKYITNCNRGENNVNIWFPR